MALIIAIVIAVLIAVLFPHGDQPSEINYGFFREQLRQAQHCQGSSLETLKFTGEFVNPPDDPEGKTDRRTGEKLKLKTKFTTNFPVITDQGDKGLDQRSSTRRLKRQLSKVRRPDRTTRRC